MVAREGEQWKSDFSQPAVMIKIYITAVLSPKAGVLLQLGVNSRQTQSIVSGANRPEGRRPLSGQGHEEHVIRQKQLRCYTNINVCYACDAQPCLPTLQETRTAISDLVLISVMPALHWVKVLPAEMPPPALLQTNMTDFPILTYRSVRLMDHLLTYVR